MKRWLAIALILSGCGTVPAHVAAPVAQGLPQAHAAAFDPQAYTTEVTWAGNAFFKDAANVGKKCHMKAYLAVRGNSDFFPTKEEVWALRGPDDVQMWAYQYSYPVLTRSTLNPFNGGLWAKLGVKAEGPASAAASTIYFTVDSFDQAFNQAELTLRGVQHGTGPAIAI